MDSVLCAQIVLQCAPLQGQSVVLDGEGQHQAVKSLSEGLRVGVRVEG